MSGSIYQVGVHLMARDGVSGVLANISKSVLGLHGSVGHLQKGFSGLQVGLIGAAAVAAGVKIGHMTEKLIEHGFEMQHWKAQMMAAGATSEQIVSAVGRSWEVAGKNVNTTASDNLKNIIELNKATGEWGESIKLLPAFAMADTAMKSIKAEGMHNRYNSGTQTLNLARALEELTATQDGKTEEERQRSTEIATKEILKTMISSRGLIDGNAMYRLTNTSKGGAAFWSPNYATVVAPIMDEITKGKIGNSDYMMTRTFKGGTIQGEAVKQLVKYGLARFGKEDDPNADAYQDKKGFHLKKNSHFAEGIDRDKWEWSKGILDKLKASGFDINDKNKISDLTTAIGSNASNTMLLRQLLVPLSRKMIQKEIDLRNKTPDDAADILQKNDPFLKLDALKKKWDDFLVALGTPMVDPAMRALDRITASINTASQYLSSHQAVAEKIGDILISVSIGLAAIGTVLIGGAIAAALGSGGWLIAGLAALGGIVATFKPDALRRFADGFKEGWSGLINGDFKKVWAGIVKEWEGLIDMLPDSFKSGIVKLDAEISSWPGRLAATIAAMGSSIVDALKGAFTGFMNGLGGGISYQGGGVGSGGGIIKASYGGSGGGFSGRGSGAFAGGASAADLMAASGSGGGGFNTRGVRNRNIGNIGWGPWARAHGAIGGAGRDSGHMVAVFPTFEAGAAAAGALASTKYASGRRSIDSLIAGAHGWTPGNHGAAANIARMMGISPFADAHLNDSSMMSKFKDALSVQELGSGGAHFAKKHMNVPPPPKAKQMTPLQINLHMDKKRIASHVIEAMLHAASGPSRGGQMPDDSCA